VNIDIEGKSSSAGYFQREESNTEANFSSFNIGHWQPQLEK